MVRSRALGLACCIGVAMGLGATFCPASSTSSASTTTFAMATRPPAGPTCGGAQPKKPDGTRYVCTLTDEFDGNTLNTARWTAVVTSQHGYFTAWDADSVDCYTAGSNNVSVRNGVLRLTSRVEAKSFRCQTPAGAFTTNKTAGSVSSSGKFGQTYGRFEFRAKFPSSAGPDYASALWMYPQTHMYGAWPGSGEIDVAEWFGTSHLNQVFPSVHYAGEDTTNSTGRNCVVSTAGTAFHTYAVEWTPTTMSFYYDGSPCFQHSWTPDAPLVAPQPFDQPFNLAMTQAGGYKRPAGTALTMEVDWVRVWK